MCHPACSNDRKKGILFTSSLTDPIIHNRERRERVPIITLTLIKLLHPYLLLKFALSDTPIPKEKIISIS